MQSEPSYVCYKTKISMFWVPVEFPLKVVVDTSCGVENYLVKAVRPTAVYQSVDLSQNRYFYLKLILVSS